MLMADPFCTQAVFVGILVPPTKSRLSLRSLPTMLLGPQLWRESGPERTRGPCRPPTGTTGRGAAWPSAAACRARSLLWPSSGPQTGCSLGSASRRALCEHGFAPWMLWGTRCCEEQARLQPGEDAAETGGSRVHAAAACHLIIPFTRRVHGNQLITRSCCLAGGGRGHTFGRTRLASRFVDLLASPSSSLVLQTLPAVLHPAPLTGTYGWTALRQPCAWISQSSFPRKPFADASVSAGFLRVVVVLHFLCSSICSFVCGHQCPLLAAWLLQHLSRFP